MRAPYPVRVRPITDKVSPGGPRDWRACPGVTRVGRPAVPAGRRAAGPAGPFLPRYEHNRPGCDPRASGCSPGGHIRRPPAGWRPNCSYLLARWTHPTNRKLVADRNVESGACFEQVRRADPSVRPSRVGRAHGASSPPDAHSRPTPAATQPPPGQIPRDMRGQFVERSCRLPIELIEEGRVHLECLDGPKSEFELLKLIDQSLPDHQLDRWRSVAHGLFLCLGSERSGC
jgi:hypothetical protein